MDCVWKTDKYVVFETIQNRESSKPIDDKVSEDATTTRDSLVQYQTSVSPLGGKNLLPALSSSSNLGLSPSVAANIQ